MEERSRAVLIKQRKRGKRKNEYTVLYVRNGNANAYMVEVAKMTLPNFLLFVEYVLFQIVDSDMFVIFILGAMACIVIISVPYIIRYLISLKR